jgi:YfiH family protein
MIVDMNQMILPAVRPPFAWRSTPGGPALVCRALEPFAAHLFTTNSWELGSRGGRDAQRSWDAIAAALDVEPARLVRLKQVHGADAVIADASGPPQAADIVVTRDPSVAMAVQAADCVPMLLVDSRGGGAGAAHAGWRGMAARAPQAAVRAMIAEHGSRPGDMLVALGPSIGACCYEVGADVRRAFVGCGFSDDQIARWFMTAAPEWLMNPPMPGFSSVREGHWVFDGWTCVREQLIEAGIPATQIFSASLCTASHAGLLCSYRRDGAPAGRLAAAIRIAPPR